MRFSFVLLLSLASIVAFSQRRAATISGIVTDETDRPLSSVSVVILGRQKGITTNDSGRFTIATPSERAFSLIFTYTGFKVLQRNFNLSSGESETITVQLEKGSDTSLQTVTVTNQQNRTTIGQIAIDPTLAINNPSPIGGIEAQIKTLVGSQSELTSQYNVRGGSFDENLVYVNDFEIFRPYLIRNGQQEGLSFINPEMAGNVNFYIGGFQAKYGDKMSSVLDVDYRQPKRFGGSAYIGLLEQGLHFEGASAKKKFTYIVGARNRSLRNLLSAQETKGNYSPSSSDLQGYITWQPGTRWLMEALANVNNTNFTLYPEESKQTTSVFSPLYTQNLGLDVYYEGQEKDKYRTAMLGLASTYKFSESFKLKGMLSRFQNKEEENIDIGGSYLFGDRDFDRSQATFGLIVNPLGAGYYQNFSRNRLNVEIWNATLRGTLVKKNHYIQFGNSFSLERITDVLKEFEYRDSAGYSLPSRVGPLAVYSNIAANSNLNISRLQGFAQDNWTLNNGFTIQGGLRYNYNNLNQEFLISPRLGVSYKPEHWNKNIIFRAAAGVYNQPPFYREMRRPDGTVNTALKAQKSVQYSAAMDYNFQWSGRPFRLNTEAYYKDMRDVVPYDIDNVRLRYFGTNSAKAYAYGLETRLYGELVQGAESWVSIGLSKTMENLDNDFYYKYLNSKGQEITATTTDRIVTDSAKTDIGWLRRPTDRRITFGLFFQDYLSTNKNFKVSLNIIYGSNLPYNIPGNSRYRNALEIPSYIRTDIGFSALLLDGDKSKRRSHNPLRGLDNIWASLEVFNLIDRANTISYSLIKDFSNNIFTIPNRLTPRLINLKLVARW